MSSVDVLTLPGYGGSGLLHWQTRWEVSSPNLARVEQREWERPVRHEWVAAIETAVRRAGPNVVLAAHSLACLAVAHWACGPHSPIKGALLVAVPDPTGSNFPPSTVGFGTTPLTRFSFPSIVVISSDDPYSSPQFAEDHAAAWGSRVVHIGPKGHINGDSGLGMWDEGRELLESLIAG